MAIIHFETTLGSSMATLLKNAIDAGAGPGTIKIYTGSMPATPGTAISSQTLLGTLTCSDPCGTVTDNVLTFSAITSDSSADATGTAAWARISDSNGNGKMDLDVGAIGSGAALQMNATAVVAGGPIAMYSLTITFP